MKTVRVGSILQGYVGGYFGRDDSYGPMRVEAIGADWVVARLENGHPVFAHGRGVPKGADLLELLAPYLDDPEVQNV